MSAERQQLSRESRRALAGLHDLLGVLVLLVRFGNPGEQKFARHPDHRQDVVEVVSDSTGESADRFHFLGLA